MIKFSIKGLQNLDRITSAAQSISKNNIEWIESKLAQIMKGSFKKTFDQGQSGGWDGLAESTQKSRSWIAKKYGLAISPSSPILKRFGALKDVITTLDPDVHRSGANRISAQWGEKAIQKSGRGGNKTPSGGTVVEKFRYNQEKRKMLVFRDEDEAKINLSYSQWVQAILRNHIK